MFEPYNVIMTTFSKPKISIIVPIYNVSTYLRECLLTIKQQSYQNLEILLINDGSTDGSGIICNEFVSSDSRFKVFHTANHGLSAARNLGLQNVTGDYIAFVDGDDKCDFEYFKNLIYHAMKYDSDLVFAGTSLLYRGGTIVKRSKLSSDLFTKEDCLKALFSIPPWNCEPISGGYVWTKLFSRDLIRDLIFDTSSNVSEDEIFSALALLRSKRPSILNRTGYIYRQRKSSLSNNRFFNYKILHSRLKILEVISKTFSDNCDRLYEVSLIGVCLAIVQSVSRWHMPKVYPEGERDFIKQVNTKFLPIAKKLMLSEKLPYSNFVVMSLLHHFGFALTCLLVGYNSCRFLNKRRKWSDYFD